MRPPLAGSTERQATTDQSAAPLPLFSPLVLADRACCCSARPTVVVEMPVTTDRPHPTDLLMCAHHYREHQETLIAAGAAAYDESGALKPSDLWVGSRSGRCE